VGRRHARPGRFGHALKVLALDVGSSSVKAAVLTDGTVSGGPVRQKYETILEGVRVEIDPAAVWGGIVTAVKELDPGSVDLIALTTLGPAFIAMDKAGEPLTPLITHADRRSVEQARQIEREVGRNRLLEVTGNRPYPGGIASTTWRWYAEQEPERLKGADLVGALTTWLHRRMTGQRVIDPSQASFMGVYRTTTLDGWEPDLVAAVKGSMSQLPEVHEANRVAGRLQKDVARNLGLPAGVPMQAGCLDGSAVMLAAISEDADEPGLLVNSVGSTDVLAMLVDEPKPRPRLLTRALGVGRRWVAVATLASAGTTLAWAHRTLFPELASADFHALIEQLGTESNSQGVRFRPFLAGDRTTLNQPRGGFSGLTLATTRDEMLTAVLDGLAEASAARVPLLAAVRAPRPLVFVTGGAAADVLYRDWPAPADGRDWTRREVPEATLAGAAVLAETVVTEGAPEEPTL
jgi:xylulokinase